MDVLILQFCDGWQQYRNISHTQQAARPARLQPHSRMPSDAGTHARRLLLLLHLMMVVGDMNRLLPGRTTANTGELWPELARSTLLLPVVLAVAAGSTVGTLATGATDLRRAGGTNRLFVRSRDDLGGKVEPDHESCQTRWNRRRSSTWIVGHGTHHSRRYSTPSGVRT